MPPKFTPVMRTVNQQRDDVVIVRQEEVTLHQRQGEAYRKKGKLFATTGRMWADAQRDLAAQPNIRGALCENISETVKDRK